jgi:hypothetical protein
VIRRAGVVLDELVLRPARERAMGWLRHSRAGMAWHVLRGGPLVYRVHITHAGLRFDSGHPRVVLSEVAITGEVVLCGMCQAEVYTVPAAITAWQMPK